MNEVEPVIKTILREQERRRRETQSTKMLRASQSNENIYSVLRPSTPTTPTTSRKQTPEVSTSPLNQNQLTRTRSFTPEGFVERESMIGDPSARVWWRNCFGHVIIFSSYSPKGFNDRME